MTPIIQRIDSNTRMSQAVVYNGVVYLAGQVDETAKLGDDRGVVVGLCGGVRLHPKRNRESFALIERGTMRDDGSI